MVRTSLLRKTIFLFVVSVLFIHHPACGQPAQPDSAKAIIRTALAQAQSAHKNVFLLFHATWCSWCKRLETALRDTSMKPIIDENYVVAMIDVLERGAKIQTNENPGGQALLEDFGGMMSGLPFIVFLNRKGTMIANSNVMPDEQNIGYPGSDEEINAFITLLQKTGPHITTKQLDRIKNYFDQHAPK